MSYGHIDLRPLHVTSVTSLSAPITSFQMWILYKLDWFEAYVQNQTTHPTVQEAELYSEQWGTESTWS